MFNVPNIYNHVPIVNFHQRTTICFYRLLARLISNNASYVMYNEKPEADKLKPSSYILDTTRTDILLSHGFEPHQRLRSCLGQGLIS